MQPIEGFKYFAIIFTVTIFFTRFWIYFMKMLFKNKYFHSAPTIKGIKLHHYMYGILIVIIGIILKMDWVISIGAALFIDEFVLLLKHGNNFHWKEYWSSDSIIWTLIIIFIVWINQI